MRIFYWQYRHGRWLIPAAVVTVALLVTMLIGVVRQAGEVSVVQRQVPVYEVATEEQKVALSFDASWGAEYTPLLLDTLDEYQVKATFFLVNIWLNDYPDKAREIATRGHEIGLHSVTHPEFTDLSDEEIVTELADNYALIESVTGFKPTLFRPPFGDYDDRVVSQVRGAGYECIQWSVDSLDWKDLSAEEIFQRVTRDLHAGDIVLMHNNGLHTAEALPLILDYLQQKGLQAVSVSDLLLTGDYYVDVNGVQRSGSSGR